MAESLPGLQIRRRLGRNEWGPPKEFGPDGWYFKRFDGAATMIVTADTWQTDTMWVHASIARPNMMPTYEDLAHMHRAVYQDGYAFQVFVPRTAHISIHDYALHLWGRLDGRRPDCLPDFGAVGSI